jgi:hypothetical protein
VLYCNLFSCGVNSRKNRDVLICMLSKIRLLSRIISSALLILTGLFKLSALAFPGKYLFVTDRLTGLSYGVLMLIAGNMELVIAFYIIKCSNNTKSGLALLWFVICVSLYRFGNYIFEIGIPCPCMGHFGSWVGFTPRQTDKMAIYILILLLMCSIMLLTCLYHKRQCSSPVQITAT